MHGAAFKEFARTNRPTRLFRHVKTSRNGVRAEPRALKVRGPFELAFRVYACQHLESLHADNFDEVLLSLISPPLRACFIPSAARAWHVFGFGA
eukprot:1119156-Pelagomonas_calceolata.AAC.4